MFKDFQQKELNFFNAVPAAQPFDYAMVLPPIEFFSDKLTAEGSVRYFVHPMAPTRTKKYTPTTRFLVTLRNPALRMFSHWRMEHYLMENRDDRTKFHDVVQEELAKVHPDADRLCFPASKANKNPKDCFP